MSRAFSILLTISIVVVTAATLNISGAQARDQAELNQLFASFRQANYGVDVNYGVIPVILMDIVHDKMQDYDLRGGDIAGGGILDDNASLAGLLVDHGNNSAMIAPGGGGGCNGVGNPDCLGKGNCYGAGNPNCADNLHSNRQANGRLKDNGQDKDNGKDISKDKDKGKD
jgi:hypothetical protein